jgi:hypothetical protein
MINQANESLRLQALLMADHIYRDQTSGKYILAGVFHHLYSPAFPVTFGRSIGLYISLLGMSGEAEMEIKFVDLQDGHVWLRGEAIKISNPSPGEPVELAIEVPQVPLPHAGDFAFQVWVNGLELGQVKLMVESSTAQAIKFEPASDQNR